MTLIRRACDKTKPRVGFEPTIPVFKRVKTFHALGRPAIVMTPFRSLRPILSALVPIPLRRFLRQLRCYYQLQEMKQYEVLLEWLALGSLVKSLK
jgi:hypothetical protein